MIRLYREELLMEKDWSQLLEKMPLRLAPSMAKDHPNLPVVKEDNIYVGFVSKTAIFNKYRAMLKRQADYMN